MKRNNYTHLVLIIVSFLTFGIKAQSLKGKSLKKEKKEITILAVGDIMMGTTYPNESYLPKTHTYPFKDVHNVLSKSDILFGNLEGTLTNTGENAKNCKDPSKCYSFKSPESYGKFLKKAGFDVVSISNNHIGDFGSLGVKNTLKTLDKNEIASAGILSKPSTIFEKNGYRYGFVAFSPNKGCLKINNLERAKKIVADISSKVDFTIVSFHGGAEGIKHKNITRETEYFYGEDRGNVYIFSHLMIDSGADIVLGHGPHVVRAMEVYKNKLIAYSLGNFCTYKRFSLTGVKAYSPILEATLDENGDFLKGKIHSAMQTETRYPFIDKEQKAFIEIKQLTLKDFPKNKIKFFKDGSFSVKN